MTPEKRAFLSAAWDRATALRRELADDDAVIAEMVADHGATFRRPLQRHSSDAFLFRLGGVSSTCTGSASGALRNWLRLASLKLATAAMEDLA